MKFVQHGGISVLHNVKGADQLVLPLFLVHGHGFHGVVFMNRPPAFVCRSWQFDLGTETDVVLVWTWMPSHALPNKHQHHTDSGK